MSDFSELLARYVKERGFSNNSFAAQCGIERTLLQKYLSGSRLPHSEETVDQMGVQLRLSPDEREKLTEAFHKDRLGSEVYEQYQIIEDMLGSFSAIAKGAQTAVPEFTVVNHSASAEAYSLLGKQEILGWFWRYLGADLQIEQNDVYLVVQPGRIELDGILQGNAGPGKAVIHQIICIDPDLESRSNLNLLKNVMPLTCAPVDYDLRYYYGTIDEHINSMNLMPNLIIMSWCVVLFDYGMTRAIVSTSPAVREVYLDIYHEMESKSRSFLRRHENILEIVQFYRAHHPCDVSLQFQPCVGYALDSEVLGRLLRPEVIAKAGAVAETFSIFRDWELLAMKEQRCANRNYFTKAGFQNFLRTGRVTEFPSVLYNPPEPADRIRLARTMIYQMKTGLIEGYLIKEDKVKIDAGLVVQMAGQEAVHFLSANPDGTQTVLELRESSLIRTFSNYLKYLADSSKTESREDTVSWLERELEIYEISLNREAQTEMNPKTEE